MKKRIVDLSKMTPEMTRELNEIAEHTRKGYTEMIDHLSEIHGKEEFWWDSPLASRHNECACFENVCRLKLIRRMCSRGEADEVIVTSEALKKAIEDNLKIEVRSIKKKGRLRDRIWQSRLFQTLNNYQRMARRFRTFRKDPAFRANVPKNEQVILISSFAIPAELKNGVFTDRYFPGLAESTSEKLLFYVNMVYSKPEEIRDLVSYLTSHSEFALSECFAEESDLAEVRRYIRWCSHFRASRSIFEEMDVTALIQNAILEGGHSSIAILGILKAEGICRLIEEQNLKVTKLIEWFEGQASSSALIRRVRKKYPDIPTMAYMNSPCGENNLALYPSKQQYANHIVPECYGTQGRCWDEMVHQFCSEVKCATVPSFRQQAVFDTARGELRERKGILLTVPFFLDVAHQMLTDFFEAVSDCAGLFITVKNHPAREAFRLADYGIEPEQYNRHQIEYVTGSLSDALKGKQVVLMSKTTMALEVMLTGAYTILYLSRGELSNFCMPDHTEQYRHVACDVKELRQLLEGERKGLLPAEADALRPLVFAKTDQQTMRNLLERN